MHVMNGLPSLINFEIKPNGIRWRIVILIIILAICQDAGARIMQLTTE